MDPESVDKTCVPAMDDAQGYGCKSIYQACGQTLWDLDQTTCLVGCSKPALWELANQYHMGVHSWRIMLGIGWLSRLT